MHFTGVQGFEDFVSTESADCVTDSSPLYGLDCEMVRLTKGLKTNDWYESTEPKQIVTPMDFSVSLNRGTSWPGSLWWIAVANVWWTTWCDLQTVSSTISPGFYQAIHTKVTKQCSIFCTYLHGGNLMGLLTDRFSGITAAMLQPVTTIVSDVQAKLLRLLPRDAVLVGHSLDNDLMALKVSYWLMKWM